MRELDHLNTPRPPAVECHRTQLFSWCFELGYDGTWESYTTLHYFTTDQKRQHFRSA